MNPGPPRSSRTRSRHRAPRSAGACCLVRFVVVMVCVLLAMPGAAMADPTTGPVNADNEPAVQVTVTQIQPAVSTPEATITITGRITNITDSTLTDLSVRLQRDARQTTRSGLNEVDTNAPAYDADVADFTAVPGQLGAKKTTTFTASATAQELGMQDSGVYPMLINVNGVDGGQLRRIGQAATMMPFFATLATSKLGVGWLWPLIDRPHRSVSEVAFIDDDLAASVSVGGRLDRMLALAETFGRRALMTLVVDPNLLAELTTMQRGYRVPAAPGDGTTTIAGGGQAAAAEWLQRLRALVADVPIASLAYADVDVVAMQRSGLGSEIAPARKTGATIVQSVLGVAPITGLDWPINGVLTDAARDADVEAGVSQFVLSGAAFDQPTYLSSEDNVTESPLTALPGAESATAVTLEPMLNRILAQGETYAAGTALATQRFVSELSAILGEAPNRSRSVLVAPPRRWSPPPGFASALLALSSTTKWLQPRSLADLNAQSAVNRGPLVYPPSISVQELFRGNLNALKAARTNIDDLSSSMTLNDSGALLGQYQKAIWRALSTANRATPATLVTRTDQIAAGLAAVRQDVHIIPPSNGTYTLSASNAPLVFTIENKLPVTVTVRLSVGGTTSGLSAPAVLKQVPKQAKLTVTMPSRVDRSGTFTIVAKISTPGGQPLGRIDGQSITVRSTAYGTVALIVTGVAFALLLVLVTRRIVRRSRLRGLGAGAPPLVFDLDRPNP